MSRIVEINTTGKPPVSSVEELFDRSCPEPNTGCWLWMGSFFADGYGSAWTGSKSMGAHRLAWQLARGAIPAGLCVCHKCDTPACVNPEHLFVGTYADNAHDRDAKGRQAKGDRNGSRLYPERLARGDANYMRRCPGVRQGEKNARALITETQVRTIRTKFALGVFQKDIAREFGVHQTTVSNIIVGKTWRHVS